MFETRASIALSKKKDFSADERKQLAKDGKAMPDGSYPITNAHDLESAISLVGKGKDPENKIKAHIKARAKDLGLSDKLPADWTAKKAERCLSAFASRTDIARKSSFSLDPLQSDPKTTDTMQEDPSVDGAPKAAKYYDALRSGQPMDKLKKPGSFMQAQPMNVGAISASLNKANE